MTFTSLRIKVVLSIPSYLLFSRSYKDINIKYSWWDDKWGKICTLQRGSHAPRLASSSSHSWRQVLAFAPRALSIAGKHILGQNHFLFKRWRLKARILPLSYTPGFFKLPTPSPDRVSLCGPISKPLAQAIYSLYACSNWEFGAQAQVDWNDTTVEFKL